MKALVVVLSIFTIPFEVAATSIITVLKEVLITDSLYMTYGIHPGKEMLHWWRQYHSATTRTLVGELHRLTNRPMTESLVSSSQQKGLCETRFPLHVA